MEGYGNENPGAFQSTRPLRGATAAAKRAAHERPISTHAPLAGRDSIDKLIAYVQDSISTHAPLAGRDPINPPGIVSGMVFQPTRPLRGATAAFLLQTKPKRFQPTRPLRGATCIAGGRGRALDISTHAPLAGRDTSTAGYSLLRRNFNPRAPCGARRKSHSISYVPPVFQPTRPLRGATIRVRLLLQRI